MNISNYTTDREIGKGGMATVYLARHNLLDRQVAFKVMDPILGQQKGFLDKFLDEGRIVASLEHPNIVKIYDVGIDEAQSTVYMAMEYLAGGSLKERLRDTGALSLPDAMRVLEQMGAGLELAHQRGFIHRDIKPGNILFRQSGEAVLTDFGIAKLQDSMGDLTRMGYTLGTARYMSPEQASTTHLDSRSDIYSLGLVFYEMLTGKAAVAAGSTVQAIHSHVTVAAPELPVEYSYLQPVLNTVLAKSPDERYPTVAAFVHAVRSAGADETSILPIDAMVGSTATSTAYSAQPTQTINKGKNDTSGSGNKPLLISALVGFLLIAVVGVGLFLSGGDGISDNFSGADNVSLTGDSGGSDGTIPSDGFGDNVDSNSGAQTGEGIVETPLQREKVNLVLDMWGRLGGGISKVQVARDVLGNMIDGWDTNKDIGLLAYGHNRKGDCGDIEQLIPVGAIDKQAFKQKVISLNPKGKTPIASALKMAAEALKYQEDPATVILISDGKESCQADPCGVARELEQAGINFTAHVVGFDINDDETRKQLQCIAEVTGGTYEAAKDGDELKKALAAQAAPAAPIQNTSPTATVVSKPTETPKPPVITHGKLRVVSLSAATGQPLKADIYVYQLEKSASLPKNDGWWNSLGVHDALVAGSKLVASEKGVTDVTFNLIAGFYRVEVKKTGSHDEISEINLVAGKVFTHRIELKEMHRSPDPDPTPDPEPVPDPTPDTPVLPTTGILQVSVFDAETNKPLSVNLYVQTGNGKQVEKKTWVTSGEFVLNPGVYTVTARTKYVSVSNKVKLLAGKTIQHRFAIKKPEPEKPKLAAVLVKAVDDKTGQLLEANFVLLQDNKQVSKGRGRSFKLNQLKPGKYTATATLLSKMGQGRGRTEVVLKAGESREVVIRIKRRSIIRPPILIKPPPLLLNPNKPLEIKKPPSESIVNPPVNIVPVKPAPAKPEIKEDKPTTPNKPKPGVIILPEKINGAAINKPQINSPDTKVQMMLPIKAIPKLDAVVIQPTKKEEEGKAE